MAKASPTAAALAAKSGSPSPAHARSRGKSSVEKSIAPLNFGADPVSSSPSALRRLTPGRAMARRALKAAPGAARTFAERSDSVSEPRMTSPAATSASTVIPPVRASAGPSTATSREAARAGGTPSSPFRRSSASTLACFALALIESRGTELYARAASPFALSARSSGPNRNSAFLSLAPLKSARIDPATRHGIGPPGPTAVPVRVANPEMLGTFAASPASARAPSNTSAGQPGPASTEA